MSAAETPAPPELPPQVVATAGHVDHGKSALIVQLTGIDPDRWEEEKRRGLTIDLGFAWGRLPSGREIGFVDVPGHERFVRNMLAGVGSVRLVLFVVAADEGWKPQSEEHLAIVDVLGAHGGVVALTKRDLVDDETLALREHEVRDRLAGTSLAGAPVIACSSVTGAGIDEVRRALDDMVGAAPAPEDRGRARIPVDRSFTIRGAGTVVTGTLSGGTLAPGQEVRVYPDGGRLRIRSLQTHRRTVAVARPVSRVAANLAGVPKEAIERGDVLGLPGQWRPSTRVEGRIRGIRGLAHPLTPRGAYKLYVGSTERDARLRLIEARELRAGEEAYARISVSPPIVAEFGDRFVLREAGRRETVAGGVILDPHPPSRPGPHPEERLRRREAAAREELPAIVVREREAVRESELPVLTGSSAPPLDGAVRVEEWWISEEAYRRLTSAVRVTLEAFHRRHPLRPGMDRSEARAAMLEAAGRSLAPAVEGDLGARVLAALERDGLLVREGNVVRLATHRVSLGEREEEARRLVAAVAAGEPTPPTVRDLQETGFAAELIEACVRTGRLSRVSDDVVLTPDFARRAEEVARAEAARPEGLTVSRFRELLSTTRKYALPMLESLDARRVTRREGDVRRLVEAARDHGGDPRS